MTKIIAKVNETKKDTILKKAAVLFRIMGFKASSMRELALKIGVEAPSLYNHIGSKNELLQHICFAVANDFKMHLGEVELFKGTNTQKIELLVRFHIQMMVRSFDEVYVANNEWKHLEEPYLSNFLDQRKQYENKLIDLVKKGILQKELKNVHPQVSVLTILSAVRGVEFWQRQKKDITAEDLENNMVNQLLTGLIN